MRIGLACDHAGVELRDLVGAHLRRAGYAVVDLGGPLGPDDDYVGIVVPLADAVATGQVDRGLFFCGSGIGPAVAANKIPGVRAAVVSDEWSARDAVTHVDVNLLTLGQRVIGSELATSIVDAYLGARPEGGRHARRREQIAKIESERGSGFAGPREVQKSGADSRAARRATRTGAPAPGHSPTAIERGIP